MTVTEQLVDAPVPARVHVPPGVKVTVPVGALVVPGDVSATAAVHLVTWLTNTVAGAQATLAAVVRIFTVTVVLSELAV